MKDRTSRKKTLHLRIENPSKRTRVSILLQTNDMHAMPSCGCLPQYAASSNIRTSPPVPVYAHESQCRARRQWLLVINPGFTFGGPDLPHSRRGPHAHTPHAQSAPAQLKAKVSVRKVRRLLAARHVSSRAAVFARTGSNEQYVHLNYKGCAGAHKDGGNEAEVALPVAGGVRAQPARPLRGHRGLVRGAVGACAAGRHDLCAEEGCGGGARLDSPQSCVDLYLLRRTLDTPNHGRSDLRRRGRRAWPCTHRRDQGPRPAHP